MKAIKDTLIFISILIIDLIAYYTSLFFTSLLYIIIIQNVNITIDETLYFFHYYFSIYWIPFIIIIINILNNLYSSSFQFWDETKILIKSITLSILIILGFLSIKKWYGDLKIYFFFILYPILILIYPILRYYGKLILYKLKIWRFNAFIIGIDEDSLTIYNKIRKDHFHGYYPVGFICEDNKYLDIDNYPDNLKEKILGTLDNIERLSKEYKVRTVFIVEKSLKKYKFTDISNTIRKTIKHIIIIPDSKEITYFNSSIQYLFMEKLYLIKIENNLKYGLNRVIKRLIDFILIIIFFIPFLILFLIISLAIKLESKGKIIEIERRIGLKGKIFDCYKFRVKYTDKNEFTNVGKFLLKTKLHNLPQFINIINGNMTFVGCSYYTEDDLKYPDFKHNYIFIIPPGITSLSLIDNDNTLSMEERIEIDHWYVRNWSLWLDFIIIIKTIIFMTYNFFKK